MRALTAAEFLDLWEKGARQPPARRALLLLGAACPEETPDSLAQLSIGRVDARLLRLREAAFGGRLEAAATCPHCREKLELAFNVNDLLASRGGDAEDAGPRTLACNCDDHAITFRLPNSSDLLALAAEPDPERAQTTLLRRCVTLARRGATEIAPDALPAAVVQSLAMHMAEADPQADLQLALTCPACSHAWLEAFDIVAFFWREIETWALGLLREVHALAQAYGWSEYEIVALSPQRRRLYLEMIGA